jgi:hypothetical protein
VVGRLVSLAAAQHRILAEVPAKEPIPADQQAYPGFEAGMALVAEETSIAAKILALARVLARPGLRQQLAEVPGRRAPQKSAGGCAGPVVRLS